MNDDLMRLLGGQLSPEEKKPRRLVDVKKAKMFKFTAANKEIILSALRRGNYIVDAAALAGIDPRTFRYWMATGKDDYEDELDTEWARFYLDVVKAQAEGDDRCLKQIDDAADKGFWQAAAWRLERKSPEKWGKRVAVQLDSTPEKPTVNITDPDERIKAIKALNGIAGPSDEDLVFEAEYTVSGTVPEPPDPQAEDAG